MTKKYIVLLTTILTLTLILVSTILIKDKAIFKTRAKNIKDTITSIQIKNGDNDIIKIVNENEQWSVNVNYNIDIRTIEAMIDAIKKVEINTLVSKPSDEMLEKYNLKGNAIEVVAYDSNSKEIRKILIGEKAALSYDVYGQIDNDKNIYLLTSNLNLYDIFSPTLDKIISKQISYFSDYDIKTVEVLDFNNTKYSLTKLIVTNDPPITNMNGIVTEKEEYWIGENNIKMETYKAQLFDILNLDANIVDDTKINNTDKPLYTVILQPSSDEPKKEYYIYEKNDKDLYRITVKSEKLNYYINQSQFDRIKTTIDFIKNPKVDR